MILEKTKTYYEQVASQEEFLEWYSKQDQPTYEKPSVTVDLVIFNPNKTKILLIQRLANPFRESWALPGGFINKNEPSELAVIRETMEETGVDVTMDHVEQLYTFTRPGRDPRGWVVSIAYLAVLPNEPVTHAGDDASRAEWFDISEENHHLYIGDRIEVSTHSKDNYGEDTLAFDHHEIIVKAWHRLQRNER
jgi:ADP-ribose pyrophosphatase YjhB (NUDIX family)